MTIEQDFYLSLLTSEHKDKPQFTSVVALLTNAIASNSNLGLGLIDAFDLDQAVGAQLDAIGLWVGMPRSVPVPISGIYFTWDCPQPDGPPALSSTAGGALAATTYYVRISYVTPQGGSLASLSEATLAVAANRQLVVTSPPSTAGVTGYNVYVSTATGTETKQNAAPIAIGTNWTEPTTGLIAGAALPVNSVGTAATGWAQGYWQGPFDPSTGIQSVDDVSFRTLIRAKIAANLWDGTLQTMYAFWDYVLGPGVITLQDNQDMSLTLIFDSTQMSSIMRSLLTAGAFPLKPSGVLINYTAISGAPLFSFDLNNTRFQGWTGASVWAG